MARLVRAASLVRLVRLVSLASLVGAAGPAGMPPRGNLSTSGADKGRRETNYGFY
ncbi:MAG: hypothetical protein OXH56_12720 [Gemmatimonadetes bacterium]|nr:hypothetical protein [Gemmatimonadota bacterium]